jgi:heparan-alpha-glucosaminide N-acetyltransferase
VIYSAKQRILSVDIFRGLTIFVMMFVNDVASVKSLPWWTYHIPPGEQGITYVDVVFPAFLFIVGMMIPLAINKRLSQKTSVLRLLYHIVVRSLSLVAIGILIMNGRQLFPEASHINYALWNVLMFVGVILLWNDYPKSEGRNKIIFNVLKWLGLVLLLVLLLIYRRKTGDEIRWINPKNSSILGGIGWAYLSVSLIYLIFSRRFWVLLLAFGMLVILNVFTKIGWFSFIKDIPEILWPVKSGGLASITMAGVIVSKIFLTDELARDLRQKFLWGLGFSAILFFLGWILLPFGLAKIGSTPSWCMISSGISVVMFITLYWLVDLKGISSWAKFLKPAGSNPLLTYLLPDIYYAIFTLYHFAGIAGEGWPGVVRALLFSFFIVGVSAVLTRMHVRLQL